MRFLDWLIGPALPTHQEDEQQIGPSTGIPLLGLDALSSAAYGPEAALTLLIPIGLVGLRYVIPIIGLIILIVTIVYFSFPTGVTLVVVVSKFSEGAWLTVVVVPAMVVFFLRVNRHYARIAAQIDTFAPLELPEKQSPIAVVAAGSWSKMTQQALKFALRLTTDVYVVQIRTERDATDDFADTWELLVGNPARAAGIPPPQRVLLTSDTREFFKPFVDFVLELERNNRGKDIVVVIPDLVMAHWYENLLHNNRGAFLRMLLRGACGSRTVVVNTPFHLQEA